MTYDEIIDLFASEDDPLPGIRTALAAWGEVGPKCRALLHGFITGSDYSERTERALFVVTHLLGEKRDTASFPDLCELGLEPDRLASVMGDDASVLSYPPILLGTFGGDPAPLFRLIEHPAADEMARGDALLVLAYLARTGRIAERAVYDYLAALPARLRPAEPHFVWFGFGRAIAALGFSGLAGAVEAAIARGLITPDLMNSVSFWQDLRDSQQHPNDFDSPTWDGLAPMGGTAEHLASFGSEAEAPYGPDQAVMEPLRNPLRDVGRNDPCPCGSGKKFKKCCLVPVTE